MIYVFGKTRGAAFGQAYAVRMSSVYKDTETGCVLIDAFFVTDFLISVYKDPQTAYHRYIVSAQTPFDDRNANRKRKTAIAHQIVQALSHIVSDDELVYAPAFDVRKGLKISGGINPCLRGDGPAEHPEQLKVEASVDHDKNWPTVCSAARERMNG